MCAKTFVVCILAESVFAVVAAGCHSKAIDKAEFRSAIDNYYSSRQDCLWPQPVKFPAQADAKNESQTQAFDALTDADLLQRMPAEKKRFLVGSKRVNNYDLSSQGRSDWTPDPAEPGYGNFCFGHPKVTSIDTFNPPGSGATQYTVSYHYDIDLPGWANSAEMKTAFPRVAAESNGAPASATLQKDGNGGWQVQNVNTDSGPVSGQ
ncbi:MAG: hypothetical protein WAL75_15820 [Terracidiphilus sp.]